MAFIHLKLDEGLAEKAATCARHLKLKRAAYIRNAIDHYNRMLEKESLAGRLEKASHACRKESRIINREIRKGAYRWD